MILLGHRFIKSEPLYHIPDIDSIQNTPPSSTLYLMFNENNLDIVEHCRLNDIAFALHAISITEIIYAHAMDARFIVIPKELAKTAQRIANDYLFDAKILVQCDDEEDIEELAIVGVDGIIFSNGIVKINS
ncbi:MAG: hypothetical protein RBR59_08275 [Sulfurimonadaceae bacterium]|nr:hypothetical protein [Sulfurimonadaceae bacterium]